MDECELNGKERDTKVVIANGKSWLQVTVLVVLKVWVWLYQNKSTWLCIWMCIPTIWVNDYYKSIFFAFDST